MPTICEAAGVKPPSGIDGISLLPLLEGKEVVGLADRELYWVRREGGPFAALTSHAVRRGDWKLIHNTPFNALELYNLKDDPQEEHDLAGTDVKMRNELTKSLKLHVLQSGSVPWENPDAPFVPGSHPSTEPAD
jgi:arylsulfatase A-like enzyme